MAESRSKLRTLEYALTSLSPIERGKFIDILHTSTGQGFDTSSLLSNLPSSEESKKDSNSPWESIFSECKWTIQKALVGGRKLSRWGCAAAEYDGKLFIFGGRGYDSYTRNSFHAMDLTTYHFSILKTTGLPKPREGHSMVVYKNSLIIFGGCEGGDQEPFKDAWVYDILEKSWTSPPTKGKKPKGRDGHAACLIKSLMVIYGGSGFNTLFDDMYALNLTNFEWKELDQEGESPGPRESMGSAIVYNKFYIFGGNINGPDKETDEYTNDFFELELKNFTMVCKRLVPEGPVPCKRLNHSMVNLYNKYLVLFGGELNTAVLNDTWAYSISLNTWYEIQTAGGVTGRMAYTACAYKNQLIIYGGMNDNKVATSDLLYMTFGEINENNGKRPKRNIPRSISTNSVDQVQNITSEYMCGRCGHMQENCLLLERFPEIGCPVHYSFMQVQTPTATLINQAKEFFNPFAAILRVSEIIGRDTFGIRTVGIGHMRDIEYIKTVPAVEKIDFSFLDDNELEQQDDEFELRQTMIKKWNTKGLDIKVNIIALESPLQLSPVEVASFCSGYSSENLISALFAISEIAVIVSRNPEFLTVALIQKKNQHPPCFFVVFDHAGNLVFPMKESSYGNLSNIFSKSHLDMGIINAQPFGTTIYVYSSELNLEENDFVYDSQHLSEIFKVAFFKAPFHIKYSINNVKIQEENIKGKQVKGIVTNHMCKYWKTDYDPFSLLLYVGNRLVHWEIKKLTGRRQRDEKSMVIKMVDGSSVSSITNQIKWEKNMTYLFAEVFDCGTKKKKYEYWDPNFK